MIDSVYIPSSQIRCVVVCLDMSRFKVDKGSSAIKGSENDGALCVCVVFVTCLDEKQA